MLPSWHNVSSGSSFQTTSLILSVGVLQSLERTEIDEAQNWTRMQEAQPRPIHRCAVGKLGGACVSEAPEQITI